MIRTYLFFLFYFILEQAIDPRESYTRLVSMASSVISAMQQPDPSEATLFETPQRPRQRKYRFLDSDYTYDYRIRLYLCLTIDVYTLCSSMKLGENETALYHVAVVLDPISEKAQRWSSLLEVWLFFFFWIDL